MYRYIYTRPLRTRSYRISKKIYRYIYDTKYIDTYTIKNIYDTYVAMLYVFKIRVLSCIRIHIHTYIGYHVYVCTIHMLSCNTYTFTRYICCHVYVFKIHMLSCIPIHIHDIYILSSIRIHIYDKYVLR